MLPLYHVSSYTTDNWMHFLSPSYLLFILFFLSAENILSRQETLMGMDDFLWEMELAEDYLFHFLLGLDVFSGIRRSC